MKNQVAISSCFVANPATISAAPSAGEKNRGSCVEREDRHLKKSPTRRIIMKLVNLFGSFFLVILLVFFLGCASTAKQEGTGEYIDDSVITTKVKAAILQESSLKSTEINVETFKGVVQLSGFVNSQADINKAVQITRTVKGVKSVTNSMRLK
jgi:hypothetical protein